MKFGRDACCCEKLIDVLDVNTWSEVLCDRIDTVMGLNLYTFDDSDQTVQRINGLTGAIEDSHLPGGAIDWDHASIYDTANDLYYLHDRTADEWHRYDALNISAGSTNLGVFGGDPILAGNLTFGSFDPVSGLGYIGTPGERYTVNFATLTVTSIVPLTTDGIAILSGFGSMSITDSGLHYVTTNSAGPVSSWWSVNVGTGICTFLNTEDFEINGADFDQDTLTGFYAAGGGFLYRWTQPNGSDWQIVSSIVSTGSLSVGQATVVTDRVEFQRVYHKDPDGNITTQDHTIQGGDYTVLGVAEICLTEVSEVCSIPAGEKVCYEKTLVGQTESIDLQSVSWEIISPILARATYELADGTEVVFQLDSLPGGSGTIIAGHTYLGEAVGLNVPATLTGVYRVTWDKTLTTDPLVLNLWDIDPVESPPLFVPFQDSSGPQGADILTHFTYNDGSILDGSVGIQFTLGTLDYAFVLTGNLAIPLEDSVGELFVNFDCDGIATYRDTVTNNVVVSPVIVDCLSPEIISWPLTLCDNIPVLGELRFYVVDDGTFQLREYDETYVLLKTHDQAPAITWQNILLVDTVDNFLYLVDFDTGDWHRYNSDDITLGSVNLGVFAGPSLVGPAIDLDWGAIDPITGLGYVGEDRDERFRIDFVAETVTTLSTLFDPLAITTVEALAIDENGSQFAIGDNGAASRFHSVNIITGEMTFLGSGIDLLDCAFYDLKNLTGFYGGDRNDEFYNWTQADGSDMVLIPGWTPFDSARVLGMNSVGESFDLVPFQKVFHKDPDGNITTQDHTIEGGDYTVLGVPEICPVELSTPTNVIESLMIDLASGQTWTPVLLPPNHIVTGITVNIIIGVADNNIVNPDTTVVLNMPTGLSLTFNVNQDSNTLVPPISIFAGTGGRIIIALTLRDDS